jgi:hypothetical protein
MARDAPRLTPPAELHRPQRPALTGWPFHLARPPASPAGPRRARRWRAAGIIALAQNAAQHAPHVQRQNLPPLQQRASWHTQRPPLS